MKVLLHVKYVLLDISHRIMEQKHVKFAQQELFQNNNHLYVVLVQLEHIQKVGLLPVQNVLQDITQKVILLNVRFV